MIVVDASVLVEFVLNGPGGAVDARLFGSGEQIHAPHLVDLEIAQVIRRYTLHGDFDGVRGAEALADFADLPLHRHDHCPFLPRIWELRHNLTAYDAAYIALAEALDAPLVTRDARMVATAAAHVAVELV